MAHVNSVPRAGGKVAYEVRWRDGTAFRQRTFSAKRDADRFALRIENELADGSNTATHLRRGTTVAQVVEQCLAVDAHKLKARTLHGYRLICEAQVVPTFGHKRVTAVTSRDVEAWVTGLAAAGMSPSTVRNHFRVLSKVFRYAVRHRLVGANPCTGTPLPRTSAHQAFEPRFLTAAEVEVVASELDVLAPYGLLVRFAAYTGLRAGELAGLRIRDVNLFRKEVRVERTLRRGTGGAWIVDTPKSARSTRTVPVLNARVMQELRLYVMAHPRRAEPDAPLWPGRAPRSPVPDYALPLDTGRFYTGPFRAALAATALDGTRLHDLRHTYASLMFAAGVDPYKVSRWMGHGSLTITDQTYAHLYVQDRTDDEERVARLLG